MPSSSLYTFVIKFVTKNFQKSPNLVTLIKSRQHKWEREKKRKTKAKLKKFPLGIHFSSINLNIFRNCFNKFSKENKLHEKHFVDKDKNLSLNELSKKESSIGIDFTARWG